MYSLKYLLAYPPDVQKQVLTLMERGELAAWLMARHPASHGIRSDRALYPYVGAMKSSGLRNAPPIDRVRFDSKLQIVAQALGTHTTHSRVQGGRLKAKHEIRIAALFRDAPPAFLQMIVAHELAHMREAAHNKAFYQLCEHMAPGYHQSEFELRVYLTHLNGGGAKLWADEAEAAANAVDTPGVFNAVPPG